MNVFVVHAWNSQKNSLYPYFCDGVEYIDSVIKTIKSVVKEKDLEFRVDNESFVPGLTVRENLYRELKDAGIIFVLLDGLRPNIVYEMGFADALARFDEKRKVVFLKEKDATVLVRNYYKDMRHIPTTTGEVDTILNPPIDMADHLCDCSDALVMIYDRFDLFSLKEKLKTYLDQNLDLLKSGSVKENKSVVNEIEKNVKAKEFDTEIDSTDYIKKSSLEKFNLALSMVLEGRSQQAIRYFLPLLEDDQYSAKASFYIGFSYFCLKSYFESMIYFMKAKALGCDIPLTKYSIDDLLGFCADETGFIEWKKYRLEDNK